MSPTRNEKPSQKVPSTAGSVIGTMLERALNRLVCRDRGTPVHTLWGTHDQGQLAAQPETHPEFDWRPQANPGHQKTLRYPLPIKSIKPPKPNTIPPWPPKPSWPLWHPHLFLLYNTISKIYCTIRIQCKPNEQKGREGLKVREGNRNRSSAQKYFDKEMH